MLYQNEPLLQLPATLIQLCIDVDELMTLWRHRHALMVHRMIGRKLGTLGGWWLVAGGVVVWCCSSFFSRSSSLWLWCSFCFVDDTGTGGSSGFSYLKATAERHKVFNDLFNLSTYMIGLEYLPKLPLALRKALAFKLREEGQEEEEEEEEEE